MSDPVREARRVQGLAADPGASFVLAAAAGAGKTKVLVDRYLRLCLAGSGRDLDPRSILAITFTRRATVEIQGRLQREARRLAGLAPAARGAALGELLAADPSPRELERAAWFHEALLEDPAGLAIETLHAFCQRVLGRFAAEAGLDPRFAVIEEQAEAEYRTEALDRLEAELGDDPARAAAYARLADSAAGARLQVAGLFDRRVHLQRWLDRVCPPSGTAAGVLARPLSPCLDDLMADLRAGALAGTALAGAVGAADRAAEILARDLAAALRSLAGAGLDAVAAADAAAGLTPALAGQLAGWRAACLAAAAAVEADPAALQAELRDVRGALLTRAGSLLVVKGRAATKAERQAALARASAPVLHVALLADLLALLAHNRALLTAGLRALDLFAAAKRRDRVVDFQDLEYLALRLLRDERTRLQVHHRLDARLDHLLLDEFQDTNRNQWELLVPLLEEVLAGGEPPRSALIVGDVKQSIYGFRGAEPTVFDAAGALLALRAGAGACRVLPTNFRSLPAIVETVGALCQQPPLVDLLGAVAPTARQLVARRAAEGTVVFVRPFARLDQRSGHERAAAATVGLIRRLLAAGVETWRPGAPDEGERARPLRHEDILILARTKTRLAVYESALRTAGIPFTPAGRGLLARSREVQDILALLRWLSFPADDVAGATVLRSPLCRLSEAAVQDLLVRRGAAQPGVRRRSLREVLRATPGDGQADAADRRLAASVRHLDEWFHLAGLTPLHDLLRRIYRDGEVLLRFEIAGGEQARFNLLRLLDLALAAEVRGGSLRDFVEELERAARLGGQEEGTRPGEPGSGRVQVMTVHGAKGLQAPVVILVDAAAPPRETTEDLLLAEGPADGPWLHGAPRVLHEGVPLSGDERLPGPLAEHRRRALDRLLAEETHVLYVALTRARDRLYVLGGVNERQTAEQSARSFLGWLDRADRSAGGTGARWREPQDMLDDPLSAGPTATTATEPPATEPPAATGADEDSLARRTERAFARLAVWQPPPLPPRHQLARPSALLDDRAAATDAAGDPDAVAGERSAVDPPARRENPAVRRGTRVHAWLERACLLGALPPMPADPDRRAEWEEARAVLADPELAWIFAPDAPDRRGLSEVAVLHRRAGDTPETRLFGLIDRLVIGPRCVDIVDYKTNRIEPAEREARKELYRPQLQAYREALAPLYPDRALRCWLVWTAPAMAGCRLTEVP